MPLKGQIFTFWKLMVYVAKAKKKRPVETERLSLKVVSPGIEPGTHGFSIHCSTN